jgi:glycosyltransferase involved in cell wall biosynthesis
MADKILLDTQAHIDYFVTTFGLPREKFHRVLVGADESLFYPREPPRRDGKFRVFYYSSFLPLHGTEYVIKAAAHLKERQDIEFTVVGKGMEQSRVRRLARDLALRNVCFIDWVPFEQLPLEIAQADVCLGGHFSDVDKAKRVIAGKTFQFIAMKKPVIVGDCAGNRELFSDRHSALFVKMADAGALAEGIMELRDNATLKEKIAEAGYNVFMEKGSTAAIGREIEGIFSKLTT